MARLEGIDYVQAGRYRKGRRGLPLDTIVFHWSAGWGDAEDIARMFVSPVKWVNGKKVPRNASYHFPIGRDGKILQLVDTEDTAWHAGGGQDWEARGFTNERSIGVCLANRGPLYKDPKWAAKHEDKVFVGKHPKPGFHGYKDKFELYTDAQVRAIHDLLGRLVDLHPGLLYVCGHEDLVKGKGDPGPVFNHLPIIWSDFNLVRKAKDWKTGEWYEVGSMRC